MNTGPMTWTCELDDLETQEFDLPVARACEGAARGLISHARLDELLEDIALLRAQARLSAVTN
jgi:hypothetical protein